VFGTFRLVSIRLVLFGSPGALGLPFPSTAVRFLGVVRSRGPKYWPWGSVRDVQEFVPSPGPVFEDGDEEVSEHTTEERKPSSLPVQVLGFPRRRSTTPSGEGLLEVDDRSRPTAARRRSTAEESLQSTLSPRVGAPFPPPPKVPREGGLGVLQTG
jgi:hypothetical protein